MSIYHNIDPPPPDPSSLEPKTESTEEASESSRDRSSLSADESWTHAKPVGSPKLRDGRREVSSRTQLIESIQKGGNLTWMPSTPLERLFARHNSLGDEDMKMKQPQDNKLASGLSSRDLETDHEQDLQDHGRSGAFLGFEPSEIERPRSALHTGDFFEKQSSPLSVESQSDTNPSATTPPRPFLSSSPTTPWYTPAVPSFSCDPNESKGLLRSKTVGSRSRAPSLGSSLSSSFVFRPPTSPLVHAASNIDQEPSNANPLRQGPSPERNSRRRTLPPDGFHSLRSVSNGAGGPPNFSRPFVPPRRESSFPYQAHQPRRSLTSISMSQSVSSPQTPTLPRSRRPSLSSDCSPIQHASMVGSFEESILRGRMSTAPSKPLHFVAQIGVLGRGDCKPSLRCPAHVIVPFPAVFYNYPSIGARSFSDDSPSPYVGTIDLERSLKPIEAKKTRSGVAGSAQSIEALLDDATAPGNTRIGQALDRKKRERQRKRPTSPKGPVGGCYRVPQQGQLQIVIKNPNKTAVKLFLVPYNLDGMEAGTKTFVRQRSFSAGPILEKPLTDNANLVLPDPLQHKSILRYLIHLKFCCPSKGKYYLYDNIRVVFANRVPDGKENLRNEVQLPEPRYSSYRPSRELSAGKAGARLAAEKASKRRSSGFSLPSTTFDAMDGLTFTGSPATLPSEASSTASSAMLPFHLGSKLDLWADAGVPAEEDQSIRHASNPDAIAGGDGAESPVSPNVSRAYGGETSNPCKVAKPHTAGFVPSTSRRASPVLWGSFGLGANGFSDDFSRTASPTPTEPGEGLLARELRSIEAQQSKNGNS